MALDGVFKMFQTIIKVLVWSKLNSSLNLQPV